VITIRLRADAADLVDFAYSPLLEAQLSLHVLVAPNHHGLQHPWVRRMRRLPAELKREIAAFSFAYRNVIPDVGGLEGYPGLDEELEAAVADPTLLAFQLLRPLVDHGGVRDPEVFADEGTRRTVAARAPEVAVLLLDDHAGLAERFAALVRAYWDEAFAEEWERLEPLLADAVSEAGEVIAGPGLYAFLRTLPRRLRADEACEELRIDVPHEHGVDVTDDRRLVLSPSFFTWPHLRVGCDEPWPLTLIYPAPAIARQARTPIPSADLVRVVKALSDDSRLRILRLVAERPRSTQELATIVGMTEAGLSKHVRRLADAGLVVSRREGYYVLYSLAPDRLDSLADALRDFVGT
jgi:DNA-binding transcriptional ArsR family regulator